MTMSSATIVSSDSIPQPLQFKGEIMDFDLAGLEVDHRKRRRNRTTQSCLNCHTSKRKCDRKRPCQRCIQLGLTGLCVYEVDDPALRDDPNVDENTRLRNRIAELESLVRELRGKPHPKWAEPTFCDGDANEKWHSRSSRRLQYQKVDRDRHDDAPSPHMQGANGRIPPSIKTEQSADPAQHQLYRFTPSPTHPGAENGSASSYNLYRTQQAHQHGQGVYSAGDDSSCYSSPSSASVMTYSEARHGAVSNGEHYYQEQQQYTVQQQQQQSCSCVTNPAAGNALIGLTNQLQNTLALLRQLPEHNGTRQSCVIVRRAAELNNIMHSGNTSGNMHGSSSYEGLSTPTETELSMSPISTSSQSSIGAAPQMHEQWSSAATMGPSTGYDSYFPVAATQADHAAAVFHKSYHMS